MSAAQHGVDRSKVQIVRQQHDTDHKRSAHNTEDPSIGNRALSRSRSRASEVGEGVVEVPEIDGSKPTGRIPAQIDTNKRYNASGQARERMILRHGVKFRKREKLTSQPKQ